MFYLIILHISYVTNCTVYSRSSSNSFYSMSLFLPPTSNFTSNLIFRLNFHLNPHILPQTDNFRLKPTTFTSNLKSQFSSKTNNFRLKPTIVIKILAAENSLCTAEGRNIVLKGRRDEVTPSLYTTGRHYHC